MDDLKKVREDIVKSKGLKIELKLNDSVVHLLTNIHGTVIGHELVRGRILLTVRTERGRILAGLAREEFGLTNRAAVVAATSRPESTAVAAVEVAEKIEGEVSHRSILEELC